MNNHWDAQKAIESIIYLANRLSPASSARVMKVLLFADLTHLQKYGRLITGDSYINTRSGPEPSNIYQLMQDTCLPDGERGSFWIDAGEVKTSRDIDRDEFSISDLECLDAIIKQYGSAPITSLLELASSDESKAVIGANIPVCPVNQLGPIHV